MKPTKCSAWAIEEVERIFERMPEQPSRAFSATMPKQIQRIANKIPDHVVVQVKKARSPPSTSNEICLAPRKHKLEALMDFTN